MTQEHLDKTPYHQDTNHRLTVKSWCPKAPFIPLVILLVTAPRLSWRYTLSPVHLSHGLLSHGPLPLVSFLSHGHIPVMAVRLDPTISRNKTPDLETEVRLR